MTLDIDIGDGADALTINQLRDALDDTHWVSGWDATPGTNNMQVDITTGEGEINGGAVSTGSTQTVDFTGDSDANNPRKAVLSVDDTGALQKTLGDPMPASPSDEIRFRTYNPAPPPSPPGIVVAEVWLGAGATNIISNDIRDRRVSNASGAGTPSGVITMWSGSTNSIPAGWTLCDGSDGTPDLTDRFVVGAGASYADGETGGESSVTLTEAQIPEHRHDIVVGGAFGGGISAERQGEGGTEQTELTGGGEPHENRPPYYALAYIMKE